MTDEDGATNPMLVLGEDGIYRLSEHSPYIDAGTGSTTGLPATDLAGEARIQGAAIDCGAVEGGVAGNWVGLSNDGYGSASGAFAVPDGGSVTLRAEQGDGDHAFLGFFAGGEALGGVVSSGLVHEVTFAPTAETTDVVAKFERRTFHVSPDGDDAADGRSWETARRTINAALASAHTGDIVLCADGTYAPFTFSRNDFVTIRSVNGHLATIIDGGNAARCATFGGISMVANDSNAITNAVLEGFTLRNGRASNGGGGSYGSYRYCRFESNVSTSSYGGGLYWGVADSCVFWNNQAGTYGGGAYSATIRNCTVVGNRVTASNGYGGGCYGGSGYNSIIFGNTAGNGANYYSFSSYNNFTSDSGLVYPADGDVRIRAGSPCLDAGNNAYVCMSSDIAGAPRVQNRTVDIGAYEGGVDGFIVGTAITGYGNVSPKYALADAASEVLPHDASFTAVVGDRPFLGFSTNGIFVSVENVGDTLTWPDVASDATVTLHFATNIYVNATTGDDANGGFTPETAKKTLQVAIDLAKSGETVYVAPGTYAPVTTGNKSIRVIATEGWEKTAIDGGGTNRCVLVGLDWSNYIPTETNTYFKGFTIRNGYANDSNGCGSGVSGGRFENCVLEGNRVNSNKYGGAAFRAFLYNCLVKNNSGGYGGAADSSSLWNCTVVSNMAVNSGGGIYNSHTRNSIIWDNICSAGNSYSNNYNSISATITYSCIGGGASSTGNVSANPRFVDPENGDYRLLDHSPCIDAGLASYAVGETDLAGNPRIVGAAPDMGCFEGGVELPIPDVVTGLAAEDGRRIGIVRLAWAAAANAWTYSVERASSESFDDAVVIGTTDALFFDDTDAVPETTYWYRVSGVNPEGASEAPSAADSGWCLGEFAIAEPSLETAMAGIPFSGTISATGGAGGYVWRTGADDYTIEGASASYAPGDRSPVGVSGDDNCKVWPLPFDFPFYGRTHNKVWVSSNGTLNFDSSFTTYSPSLSTFKSRVMIAVLWRDLDTGSAGVEVATNGTDSITFYWNNARYHGTSSAANASVTLFRDGTIVCSYGQGNANGGFVGVSAGDGTRCRYIDLMGTSMSNADDIVFRPQDLPAGLSLAPDGVISGTPTEEGSFSFTAFVSDSLGNGTSRIVTIVVETNPNMRRVDFVVGEHGSRVGGGALVQGVMLGDDATAPIVRAASGWVFDGWDKTFTNIADSLTVNAKWRPAKPAIRIAEATVPNSADAGSEVEVSWTLSNWGNAAFSGSMSEEIRLVSVANPAVMNTMASVSFADVVARDGTVRRTASFTLPRKGMEGEWHVVVVSALRPSVQLHETGVWAVAPETMAVSAIPLPQLEAEEWTLPSGSLAPGDTVNASWTTRNSGAAGAAAPWTESFYLRAADGTIVRLASVTADATLAAGESAARAVTAKIPELVAVAGEVSFFVRIDDGDTVVEQSDDHSANETSMLASSPATLGKRLYLAAAATSVYENGGNVRFTARRSGPTAEALSAEVSASGTTSDVRLPTSISFPTGSASTTFNVTPVDNAVVDGTRTVSVSVAADGFAGAAPVALLILDNETPHLYLSLSGDRVREGGTLSGTVTRELATEQPLTVYLAGPATSRCAYPSSVTIAADERTASFEIAVPDNETAQREETYTLRASASGHSNATASFSVEDDDVPGVVLELYPEIASENAGANAVYATLTRVDLSDKIDQAIRIRLSHTPSGNLILPSEITIPKYTAAVRFAIGTIDNALDDGDREVTIDGAVVIESCGCDGQPSSGDAIRATMTVIDDDGPALSLKAEPATMREGLDEAGFLVLSHNSALTEDLEVALSFDVDGEIDIPATATIPAGQTSVRIPVRTLDDGEEDGSKLVSVYASDASDVFAPASTWLQVSDQNLPDLSVSLVAAPAGVVAMERFSVVFTVTNAGFMARSGTVPYAVHLVRGANNATVSSSTLAASGSLTGGIAVDGTLSGEVVLTAPEMPGDCSVAVVIDPDGTISELDKANNTGWSAVVGVSAAYVAEVVADADAYLPGETIRISGMATLAGGAPAALVPVDVYMLRDSYRKTIAATTSSDGSFAVEYTPTSGECGHYRIGACYPGVGSTAEQDEFDVMGMKRTSTANVIWDYALGDVATRTVTLKNLSAAPLTGLAARFDGVPEDCSLEYTLPETIPANGSVVLSMTATAIGATEQTDYEKFRVYLTTEEGVALDFPLYFHSQTQRAYLRATPTSINTTMTVGAERTIAVTIYNDGKGDSGPVTATVPSARWLSIIGGASVDNLASGESMTVTLLLSPESADGLALNSPLSGGRMAVNCANGTGCSVSLKFTPVSEATGSITVDAVDNNTYTLESAPHLSNATVRVSNPYTGATVATGKTGTDGIWTADNIPEGTYQLTITAPNHDSYADAITIEPGRNTRVEAFLQYQIVTATWTVERTEIEDSYDIQLLLDFETQVPAPIVKTTMPTELPDLNEGESYAFTITLENTGMIEAEKVTVSMPSIEGYTFTLSDNNVTVPAKSTVTIAAVFSRPRTRAMLMSATRGTTVITVTKTKCVYKSRTAVVYPCGKEHPEYSYETIVRHGTCTTESILEIIIDTDDDPDNPDDPDKDPEPRNPPPGPPVEPRDPMPSPDVLVITSGCDIESIIANCLKKYMYPEYTGDMTSGLENAKKFKDAMDSDCTSRVLFKNNHCGTLDEEARKRGQLAQDSYRNEEEPVSIEGTGRTAMTSAEVKEYFKDSDLDYREDKDGTVHAGRYTIKPDGTITTDSGLQATMYKDDNGGITIAYTGTQIDPIDGQDLGVDAENVLCQQTQQYEDAADLLSRVSDRTDSNTHISLTGHSLGGGLTTYAYLKNKKKHHEMSATTYNAAGICSDLIPDIDECEAASSDITNYRTMDDFVSVPGFHVGDIVTLCDPTYSGHDAKNFGLDDPGPFAYNNLTRGINALTMLLGLLGEGINLATDKNGAWNWIQESSGLHNYYLCVKEHLKDEYGQFDDFIILTDTPVVEIKSTAAMRQGASKNNKTGLDDIINSISTGVVPSSLVSSDSEIVGKYLVRILIYDIFCAAQRYMMELCIGTAGNRDIADYCDLKRGVKSEWDVNADELHELPAMLKMTRNEIQELLAPAITALGSEETFEAFTFEDFSESIGDAMPDDQKRSFYNVIWRNNNSDYAIIDVDKYLKARNVIYSIWLHMLDVGATTPNNYITEAIQGLISYYEVQSKAVCASVKLKLSQTLAMTREAFDGTLTLYNGNTSTPINALKLDVSVLDEDGNECKDLFEIFANGTSGDMSDGSVLAGGLSISAGGTGSAMVRFIPERGAAPTEEKLYRFGGTVTYIDPFSGEQATVRLTPVSLTVSPSPYLHLDYFVQRDVYADDPFTDVVEASMPAELAVLVRNNGGGEARNVRISSIQPETVRNEKGLLAAFRLQDYTDIRSALDGSTANLAISDVNLGNIDPGAAKVAQWWLTSSIEGHFTGMSATVAPLNSWNTPDTALVDSSVGTHKLVRSIVADGDALPDFLTSEEGDLYGRPDTIYTAAGEVLDVHAGTAHPEGSPHLIGPEVTLQVTITPARSGWNYAELALSGLFRYEIAKIERADGSEVPLRNAWITDRSFRDGLTPLLVERLHVVDEFASNDAVSYTVTLVAKPTDGPEVVAFEGVADGAVENSPRNSVTVVFSTAVDPATFTADDLALMHQGSFVGDLSAITITAADETNTRFAIGNLSAACGEPGRNELVVQCAGIANLSGSLGTAGRSVAWTYSAAEAPYIIGVDGVPRRAVQSLDAVTVVLSTAVDPASFTADALRLDGVAVGAGVSVRALDESGTRFEVSGLAAAQSEDGEHTLAIDPTALVSLDGEAGVAGGGDVVTWRRDTVAPRLLAIEREEGFAGTRFIVRFSEEVEENDVSIGRFALVREAARGGATRAAKAARRDGSPYQGGDAVALPETATLERLGGGRYALSGVDSALLADGAYTLTFTADGVPDEAGNEAEGSASVAWTRDATPPAQIEELRISPDLGASDSDGITSQSAVTVLGTLPDDAETVEISVRWTGGSEQVVVPAFAPESTALAAPATLPGSGNMALVVRCSDAAGNASETTLAIFLDGLALTAELRGAPEDAADVANAFTLVFSDAVVADDITLGQFTLTRDGAALSLAGASLSYGSAADSSTAFTLSGLGALCSEDGAYRLVFNGAGVRKALSGRTMDVANATVATAWTRHAPDAEPPTVVSVHIDGADLASTFFDSVAAVEIAFSEPVNVPELVNSGWIGQAVKLSGIGADGKPDNVILALPEEISWNEENSTLCWTLPANLVGVGTWRLSLDAGFIADAAGNALQADGADETFNGLVRFDPDAPTSVRVASYAMPSFGDFDGDGDLDLLVGEKSSDGLGRVQLYRNAGLSSSGTPAFVSAGTLSAGGEEVALPAQGCQGASAALLPRSVSGVGTSDLVVGDAFGNVLLHPALEPDEGAAEEPAWGEGTLLLSGSDETFGSVRAVVAACDIAGSGRTTLVVGGMDGKFRCALGIMWRSAADTDSEPNFDWLTDAVEEPLVVASGRSAPATFDLNGDGLPDLISGNTTGDVWAFLGDGRYSWRAEPIRLLAAGSQPDRSRVAVADFSGNGAPILAVGRSDGSVRLHAGAAAPSPAFFFTVTRTPPTLAEALDATSLAWTTGGASPWIGIWTEDPAAQGGNTARPEESGLAADGAWLETAFSGAGRLSLRAQVPSGGVLVMALDGSETASWTASEDEEAWQEASFALASGDHEVRWTWTAIPGVADDAAPQIDEVSWTPAPWTDGGSAASARDDFRDYLARHGLLSAENDDEKDFVEATLEDSDGDGASAWAEFVAMTDPTDPGDVFRADIVFDANGEPIVTWHPDRPSERDYELEASDGPAGPWEEVSDPGDGTAPTRFYRVKVMLK